jgi:hypothetical protein
LISEASHRSAGCPDSASLIQPTKTASQNNTSEAFIGTVDFGRAISWNGNGQSHFTDYEGLAGHFIL